MFEPAFGYCLVFTLTILFLFLFQPLEEGRLPEFLSSWLSTGLRKALTRRLTYCLVI